ncbi:TPA: hypothetical protein ACIFC2_002715 [Acinetobacter baumannii]
MQTNSKITQSHAIAAMSQVPFGPTTCLYTIEQACQQALKISSIYTTQIDEYGQERIYLNKSGHKLTSLMPILKDCPFLNGRIAHTTAHPFLESFYHISQQSGLFYIQPNQEPDQDFCLNNLEQIKHYLLTRQYDQRFQDWNKQLLEPTAQVDDFIKGISKAASGYDLQEVVCYYPINQDMYSSAAFTSQSDFAESMDTEITRLICQSEENAVLGVLVKSEVSIHYQLVRRFLIFTECQYIDDPSSFTNLEFMNEVRRLIEPNSLNRVVLACNHLNGFLSSNRFLKKSSDFKEQIKRLKAYVVGTDKFIRVGGVQPTFKVLFSKFEIKQ